jgi:hypothetical protein
VAEGGRLVRMYGQGMWSYLNIFLTQLLSTDYNLHQSILLNVGHSVHHLIGKTNNISIEANSVIRFFNSNGLVNKADKAAVLYNSKRKSILLNVGHSVHHLIGKANNTGCKSDIWKKVQANILKDPLVLLIQTRPQQKALDLSFNLAP